MGVIEAMRKVFGGRADVVCLDEPPASGTASAAVEPLITELRATDPTEIRRCSTATYLEAVIEQRRLDTYREILAAVFGKPIKDFEADLRLSRDLLRRMKSVGGIIPNQCLYLRRYSDDRVLFAALWPWEDPRRLTLKVGVLEPLA